MIPYLNFVLKSTNQHGVHSPFVFDLVTKCFYDRKKYPEYKQLGALSANTLIAVKKARLLFRLQRYFNFSTILLMPDSSPSTILDILRLGNPGIRSIAILAMIKKQHSIDFIYLNTLELPDIWKQFKLLLAHSHNNSIFFINTPYESQQTQKTWGLIQNHPQITVTVDSFIFGLVSMRKEQVKEHFVIRM